MPESRRAAFAVAARDGDPLDGAIATSSRLALPSRLGLPQACGHSVAEELLQRDSRDWVAWALAKLEQS